MSAGAGTVPPLEGPPGTVGPWSYPRRTLSRPEKYERLAFTFCRMGTVGLIAWALGPALFSSLPRLTGSRTVVTVHGLDWQREKWGRFASWVLRRCEGPAAHFPNRTIVVSKTLREHFRSAHGIEAEYIPNGTLLPQARPPRKLAALGLEPGKYVLFVGRLVPEKGVHFLCEAFSRIPTEMKLALVGGLSFSQDYVSLLKRYESDRIRLLDYSDFFDVAGQTRCDVFWDIYHQNEKGLGELTDALLPEIERQQYE